MASERKTILIVDDDEILLHVLERDLAQAGFAVLKAANGKQALQIVRSARVDVIVSDISMPEMDGLEFCEEIRRDPECVDIPFIFLTVHGGEEKRIRGLRSGADEYFVKPVSIGELIARAEILYDRVRRQRSASFLTGNLRDVALCELLQLFEMTRKQGVLTLEGSEGKGTLSFKDGSLMSATWNELDGEDAVFAAFALKDGSFRFHAKDVTHGNLAQAISFVLMETARWTDELATFGRHVPAPGVPLVLRKPFNDEDADARVVSEAIQQGCANLAAIRYRVRIPDVRLRLAIGKLVDGGFVVVRGAPARLEVQRSEKVEAKPTKILVAFTDAVTLSRCLSLLADPTEAPMPRGGVSDFSRFTLAGHAYDIVCLRGEKRFAFMWELVLKTSEGAIFLLKSDADREHAAFFSARAAALHKSVVRVSLPPGLSSDPDVRVLRTPNDIRHALSSVRVSAT